MAGKRSRAHWKRAFLLAVASGGCGSDALAPTQVVVAVDADSNVASSLSEVAIQVYDPAGAVDGGSPAPVDDRRFAVNAEKQAPGSVAFPFSVGVLRKHSDRFLLVVTGYVGAKPVIAQKALVNFVPRETRGVGIYLASPCLGELCGDLDSADWLRQTCDAAKGGMCGDVATTPTTQVAAGSELDAGLIQRPADAQGTADGGQDAALGTAGQPCAPDDSLACANHASVLALRCVAGVWREDAECEAGERCDSRFGTQQGTCVVAAPECLSAGVGGLTCAGTSVVTCNDDLLRVGSSACQDHAHCADDDSPACVCDTGYQLEASGECSKMDAPVCAADTCQHGTTCIAEATGYRCDCRSSGYSGKNCETNLDECAGTTSCDWPEYPCEQTEAPGYVCRGQLADWPMPDRQAGAKVPPRYDADSAPGVVIDQVTGLLWQRQKPATYEGCTGLSAVVASPQLGDSCSWTEAKAYCDALSLDTHSDWRLPTKVELESLVDLGLNPVIDRTLFAVVPDLYWTASPVLLSADGAHSSYAWAVNFAAGNSIGVPVTVSPARAYAVRCVRNSTLPSVVPTPADRYAVDATEDTVADARTGLIWQRTMSMATFSWDDAKLYCDRLGGGSRLPTYKELQTLVDPHRQDPCINPAFLGATSELSTPANWFWTSTPALAAGSAWRMNFLYGDSGYAPTSDAYRVRCVR